MLTVKVYFDWKCVFYPRFQNIKISTGGVLKALFFQRVLRTMWVNYSQPRATPHTCVSMGNLNIWRRKIDQRMHFMRNFMDFQISQFFIIINGFESFPGSNSNSWRDFLPGNGPRSPRHEISMKIKFVHFLRSCGDPRLYRSTSKNAPQAKRPW